NWLLGIGRQKFDLPKFFPTIIRDEPGACTENSLILLLLGQKHVLRGMWSHSVLNRFYLPFFYKTIFQQRTCYTEGEVL
ncbi:MAG: hypothetical protein R3319_02915, partial [Candidatus Bathyarchaeia archaeon]|nr:hypothetical protein [Candidatus Bathyarchaeia archaeon]